MARSVFWRVAGILVGMQVATGLLAVVLSAWFTYDRSLDLVANSLRLRLDDLAQEVEQRADTTLASGLAALSLPLRLDLSRRFPDPVVLLDVDGRVILTVSPDLAYFDGRAGTPPEEAPPPADLAGMLANGDVIVEVGAASADETWGVAPVYNADGFLAGGLLVQPLTYSIARELEGTRSAYYRALFVAAALAGLSALVLGAFFTGRLLRPLQRMTRQIERIGAGEYGARLAAERDDEIGRLAASINRMAEAVEQSVASLQATDRLRRELVANVGHDLRTPLATMVGYLEEAERYLGAGDVAAARSAVATAERQGAYLNRLVGDLFELSLLDSARPPLRREPIPPAELLGDAARAHRAAFERAGVALVLDAPPDLPLVHADGVRLLRVLDNLLANALRHTPSGGTVTLRALVADGRVRIDVRDTGRGMPPDVLAHIFERYYQGDEARTRRGTSTGLGLAISRAIARAHGGDLSASSTPGSGSTFTLALPVGEEGRAKSEEGAGMP